MAQDQKHSIPLAHLQSFTNALLSAASLDPAAVALTTHALTLADLRGHDTHGTARLPSYLAALRARTIDPVAVPSTERPFPAVACVDARNAIGFVGAAAGIDAACEAAETLGIGFASVRRGNHYGMAGWVAERAAAWGMACIVGTNSSAAMPAWGGQDKILGVSPLAAGMPGAIGPHKAPWILDMAPSVAARGKVMRALRRGEEIPEGWALDGEGRATTDPRRALEGVMLPMGGPKGSALSLMMDIFSGVLSGSAFAGGVAGPYDPDHESNVGHFMIAFRPDLWMKRDEVQERMQHLYDVVTQSKPAAGVDRVWFPGEKECEEQRRREAEGIPMTAGEIEALNVEARRLGVEELQIAHM